MGFSSQPQTADLFGNVLSADAPFEFFVLAADANHDRKVDFADLVKLAQNYSTTGGKTFDKGDYNYDGNVNFSDLVILAQRYNTTLPGAAAAGAAPVSFDAAMAAAFATIAPATTTPAPGKAKAPVATKPVKVAPPAPVSRPVKPTPKPAKVMAPPSKPALVGKGWTRSRFAIPSPLR
jgi:hypothetical protein